MAGDKRGRTAVKRNNASKLSSPIAKERELRRLRTPAEQRAEIERVAREHGADLSEEGFNEALRKVGRGKV